jgi:hypothetical protein
MDHDLNSNLFQRELEVDHPVYGIKRWGRTKITRFHCYCLPVAQLNRADNNPPRYGVYSDNHPHHGLIVPVTPIELVDVHERQDAQLVARFPHLRQCRWVFCCNLLQMSAENYATMRAGGEPKDLRDNFRDPKFVTLINCLRNISTVVEDCESSDQCFEVECWLLQPNGL